MAASCNKLCKDPGFFFKLIALAIAITQTVLLVDNRVGYDSSVRILVVVVANNSIITFSVLIILLILDKKVDELEQNILLATAITAIGLGAHLICYVYKNTAALQILFDVLCIGLGVLCIFDFMKKK